MQLARGEKGAVSAKVLCQVRAGQSRGTQDIPTQDEEGTGSWTNDIDQDFPSPIIPPQLGLPLLTAQKTSLGHLVPAVLQLYLGTLSIATSVALCSTCSLLQGTFVYKRF